MKHKDNVNDNLYRKMLKLNPGFKRSDLHSWVWGVLHLDMQPNNIVCVRRKEEDLRVKIIDFGLARNMEGKEYNYCQ